jgi:hypothetical protein
LGQNKPKLKEKQIEMCVTLKIWKVRPRNRGGERKEEVKNEKVFGVKLKICWPHTPPRNRNSAEKFKHHIGSHCSTVRRRLMSTKRHKHLPHVGACVARTSYFLKIIFYIYYYLSIKPIITKNQVENTKKLMDISLIVFFILRVIQSFYCGIKKKKKKKPLDIILIFFAFKCD